MWNTEAGAAVDGLNLIRQLWEEGRRLHCSTLKDILLLPGESNH